MNAEDCCLDLISGSVAITILVEYFEPGLSGLQIGEAERISIEAERCHKWCLTHKRATSMSVM